MFTIFIIGGYSISLHYKNMLSEQKVYLLEMNGERTKFTVSLKEVLLNHDLYNVELGYNNQRVCCRNL